MSLIEKIDAVYNEHPYKVVGDVSTYSQYNEGWSDACDRLLVVLSEQKEPCDRDYWKAEAIKATAELGEMKLAEGMKDGEKND